MRVDGAHRELSYKGASRLLPAAVASPFGQRGAGSSLGGG